MRFRIALFIIIACAVGLKIQHDTELEDVKREYRIFQLQQETREAVRKQHSINYPDGYKGRRY